MSLNGLDAPHVQEAYQTAVAEASGWFLLKYTSRDAVELLASGKNGVVEARNAIREYTDASPLYGLIIYRRRRILIKYLPDGTSRLLQARTTVHLQDVLERFAPYENLLEISSSDALSDTSLASSFQLHTASPSPSSSRLDEIREDGEDSGPLSGQPPSARSASNASAAQKYKADRRIDQLRRKTERGERSTSPLRLGQTPIVVLSDPVPPPVPPKTKPSMSQYLVREEQGQTSVTRLESPMSTRSMTEDGTSTASTKSEDSTLKAANFSDSASQTTLDAGEMSSVTQSPTSPPEFKQRFPSAVSTLDDELPGLPSTTSSSMADRDRKQSLDDDPYDLKKYDEWFKPKVKLGPRPVNPSENKNRPAAARVSALPANFKPTPKKQEPARPTSSFPESATPASSMPAAAHLPSSFSYAPPPIPNMPEYEPRPVSRGSVKSTPSHKSTMMTPDKLRLMKAIEHRKKQMRKSRDQQFVKPPTTDDIPEVPEVPTTEALKQDQDSEQGQAQAISNVIQAQGGKADSGIEMHYDQPEQRNEQTYNELSEPATTTTPETGVPRPIEDLSRTSDIAPTSDALHEKPQSSSGDESLSASVAAPVTETVEIRAGPAENGVDLARVPTIVMADGSRPITSDGPSQSQNDDTISSDADQDEISEDESTTDTLEASSAPRRQRSDLAKRRRGFVEPLQIEVNSGNPDDFASDDDEFFDELDSATVLEAKPIMVARSPINSTYPDRRPSADTTASVRSVNITRTAHSDKSSATPESVSPEPMKSPALPTIVPSPVEKAESISARNVSSGISKRIQLLTEMTNREVAQSINLQSRPLTPDSISNAFIQQDQRGRKAAVPRPRPTSFRRHSSHRGAQPAATPTPTNENAPTWSLQHDPATNRNSVSVTARIVRPTVVDEVVEDPEISPNASDTTINRRRYSAADELPPLNTSISHSNVSSPAMSPAGSRSSADARTLHSASSRFGRHRQNSSPVVDDFPPPPPPPKARKGSAASIDDAATHREGGRTSRFFKRISNFGGPKRKNSAQSGPSISSISESNTVMGPEESNVANKGPQRMSVANDTPPAVVVGDLNVQFPDSLLWKRRIVTIDEAGFLQFAIAHAMEIHKGVAQKRYPLTDFCAPYAPDLDSQELAHSVILELQDGTALQAACEDAMTQRQVLHLLRTYWKTWASIAA